MSDRAVVADALRCHPPLGSEMTFTNLYVWRRLHETQIAEVDGTLLFASHENGERTLLGSPVGPLSPGVLPELLADVGVHGGHRIDAVTAHALCRTGAQVECDRDQADYVYRRQELATLAGRRHHRKRGHVTQCLKRFDCQYEDVTPDLADELLEMQSRWKADRDCATHPGLCAEHRAIADALAHMEEFGLLGGTVRIDGRIEAFTLAERLNEDTAVIHFEKAMPAFPGLYQVVNQWFCRHALDEFEYVNREQDLGIPGLRKAKMSYLPDHLVAKFTATWSPTREPCCCSCKEGECGTD